MTDEINLRAYAKLNLMLKINGKTKDGYHDLFMVNQSISLCDELKFKKNATSGINLITADEEEIEKNLVYKAAKVIDQNYTRVNVDIELKKNIPVFAGLGGGSSDAAATILALDKLYNLDLKDEEKISLGKSIGADVPFCLFGGTKTVQGIGENLTDMKSGHFYYILIKPPQGMSTKRAFDDYDRHIAYGSGKATMTDIFEKNTKIEIDFIKKKFFNDFEKVLSPRFPVLNEIKKKLHDSGADFAQMTGSGTTIYGVFLDSGQRDRAYTDLKQEFEQVYKCQTVDKGIEYVK